MKNYFLFDWKRGNLADWKAKWNLSLVSELTFLVKKAWERKGEREWDQTAWRMKVEGQREKEQVSEKEE